MHIFSSLWSQLHCVHFFFSFPAHFHSVDMNILILSQSGWWTLRSTCISLVFGYEWLQFSMQISLSWITLAQVQAQTQAQNVRNHPLSFSAILWWFSLLFPDTISLFTILQTQYQEYHINLLRKEGVCVCVCDLVHSHNTLMYNPKPQCS